MPSFENHGAYGHLFQDSPDDCLFVRPLGSGHSCQTQLVHNYTTGGVCVRKSLRYPIFPSDEGALEDEFDHDVHTAQLLHAAAAAASHELRVSKLLSVADAPGSSRVSYWDVCNGGTLFAFLDRCRSTESVLPMGLALHILLQALETLNFMYTGLAEPVYHRDLHDSNLMLHFAEGRSIPDLHVIDFGRSVHGRPEDNECQVDYAGKVVPWWDVPSLMALVRDHLVPLTLTRDKRLRMRAAGRATDAYVYLLRKGRDNNRNHSLRRAYQMLKELNKQFAAKLASTDQAGRKGRKNRGAPPALTPPSLKPVIKFLRSAVRPHLLDVGLKDQHDAFRKAVLHPTRDRAKNVMEMRPKLCCSVERLAEWLGETGIPGPWDMAEVDAEDPKLAVLRVMPRQCGGGRKVESWEREDEEEEEEDMW